MLCRTPNRDLENGAKVIFGDVADAPSREIESQLSPNAQFIKCDSASYSDQLNLFKSAFEKHGRVDIVIANAGIAIHKDPFDPNADINEAPSMKEVEVNTIGALFSARIGMHFLRRSGGGDLVLVSSIAGFKECGGLVAYTASKHGVVGIMRGLHLTATPENIKVNVICPWMTSMCPFLRFVIFPGSNKCSIVKRRGWFEALKRVGMRRDYPRTNRKTLPGRS